MKGVFVTGTGTGVGKTVFACALARYLSDRGVDAGVMKPVSSGSLEDSRHLKAAARVTDPLSLVTPQLYKRPMAPWSCRKLGEKPLAWGRILAAFRKLSRGHKFLVVEGIGGALVPLDTKRDATDLMRVFKLPVIVVASAKLGTMNHTLLTLEALKRRKIPVLGIVLNFFDRRDAICRTNLDFFRSKRVPVLACLPSDRRFTKEPHLAAKQFLRSPLSRLLP